MKQKRQSFQRNCGQAAILLVFVLGMISILIGISLAKTGYLSSIMGRTTATSAQAFYAANSGVEDALYKVSQPSYVIHDETSPDEYNINLDEYTAKVKVYGTADTVTIESVGFYKNYVRRIRAVAQNTFSKPGFGDAIHAGLGGLEMENNTSVSSLLGGEGNVYSNSFIQGEKANNCDASESTTRIMGSAWAHTDITRLGTTGSESKAGVCIEKDAYAQNLLHCYIKGDAESPNSLGTYCTAVGSVGSGEAPEIKELPDMGIGILKNHLNGKLPFEGDCILDGGGGPQDCSYGTYKIGDIKINGNLMINPKDNKNKIQISGPIWVTKNLEINSDVIIGPEDGITEVSQVIVADGTIMTGAGDKFLSNTSPTDPDVAAFLLFISTVPSSMEICNDAPDENYSIKLSSNTDSVLFYATDGCVLVNSNGSFQGAILGQKIHIINQSDIIYDPRLQSAIFGLSKEGGWQIQEFKEY